MKKSVVFSVALLFGAALVSAPSPAAAELRVGVSGYVKLDLVHMDKITGNRPDPAPGNTPLDDDPDADNSQTIIDARESRIRVTFSDEVARVKMSGRIEFDFLTEGADFAVINNHRPRLRHAFARADHPSGFFLLAGQYWSLFMNDEIAVANTVDFTGPAGALSARQPQLRVGYRNPLARGMGDLVFEADIERHSVLDNTPVTGDPGGAGGITEVDGEGQSTPLFAGKVSWLHPRFQAEAAFAFADNKVILAGGNDASETALGYQVSAQVGLDPFTVYGHYQHLDGLGRLAAGDFPSTAFVAPTLENVETDGFYFGAAYNLTKDTSLNAVYGWHEAKEIVAVGFTGNNLETHQSIHVNVIHKFWERWQAGLEFQRFDVEEFDGTSGDVNIIRGALWFFF